MFLLLALVIAPWARGQADISVEVAMANPPIVAVVGPTGGRSVAPGSTIIEPTNSVFRYSGARVARWEGEYPHGYFFVASGVTGANAQIPYRAEFETDAREFEILTLGSGGRSRLRVDGEFVSLTPSSSPPADGNFYTIRVTFPSSLRRAISFEATGVAFGGVALGEGDRIHPPEAPLGPRCIVLGDSFTEGLTSFAQRLRTLLGWEIWGSGVGGVGYMNPGPAGRVSFRERVHDDVIAYNPEIVVIAGGINDGTYDPGLLRDEAGALYDEIASGLPSAKLVVVGPWWSRGYPPQFILNARSAIRQAAISRGIPFIDPIVSETVSETNAGWITGSGHVGVPRGDGNADVYIGPDGTHPSDAGHRYLALRLAEVLKGIPVPDPTPKVSLSIPGRIEVQGRPGRTYRVQQCDTLTPSVWSDLETVVIPVGGVARIATPFPQVGQRFFRAMLLP